MWGVQLVSLAADKVVKVWDLRNQKCLQTISPKDWTSAEDARPSCLAYDSERQRLVSAVRLLSPTRPQKPAFGRSCRPIFGLWRPIFARYR